MTYRNLVLASAASVLIALNATAQEAGDNETRVLDTVVVDGSKLSRKLGIDEKRDALQTIEALGVDELGQLPDKNVGESLNRLAGVSMLVEKGEGRYVQIRGINPSLNNITINGADMGSPETEGGGRNAPLDIISGGVLSSVQVIKTPTADMDAQGIGGTVNVDTKSPFDKPDDFYGYVTGRYGVEDIQPKSNAYGGSDPYGMDGTLSGKLMDGKLGWLAAASWSDREYVAPGYYADDWVSYEATDTSAGGAAPQNVKNNYYIIGRERLNLNGVLELRPDDNSKYYVRGFYATWDEFQHRNRYEQNFDTDISFDTATSGASGGNRIAPNIRLETADKEIFTVNLGGENIVDTLTYAYDVQAGQNSIDEDYSYWEWRSGKTFGPNAWSMSGDGIVNIVPDAGTPDRQDPSLMPFRRARFQDSHMDEDTVSGKFDVTWQRDEDTRLKAGVKARRVERNWDYELTRYDPGSQDLNLGTSASFTRGAFTNCFEVGCAPNIMMDVDAMNAFLRDPANADYFTLNESDGFVNSYASDYDITETVLAGYLMGVKQVGPVEMIGGVRVESTNVDSSGYLFVDGGAEKVSDGGDYINWLPSLLANWDVTDSVKVRGAITRALGRPDYDTIAPRSSYSEELGIGALSIGNPDLKARVSWNYDASIEWYPDDLTLLSASVFYKDISDDLVGLSQQFTTASAIEAYLASRGLSGAIDTTDLTQLDVSTTVNAGSSTLKGLELIAQTQFDRFLPEALAGIGISATATFLDGETEVDGETLPLLNQAERTYALSLFYQNYGFDASLSYAYNDNFLTDVNLDEPELNLNQGEFGRWDAKVTYSIRDNLKVFFEGVNLNNEPTTEFQGGRVNWNTEHEYVGSTFYFGVSYGF
ncbi:MAG: TonB-dependent receptor [Hyphomonas sp.]